MHVLAMAKGRMPGGRRGNAAAARKCKPGSGRCTQVLQERTRIRPVHTCTFKLNILGYVLPGCHASPRTALRGRTAAGVQVARGAGTTIAAGQLRMQAHLGRSGDF